MFAVQVYIQRRLRVSVVYVLFTGNEWQQIVRTGYLSARMITAAEAARMRRRRRRWSDTSGKCLSASGTERVGDTWSVFVDCCRVRQSSSQTAGDRAESMTCSTEQRRDKILSSPARLAARWARCRLSSHQVRRGVVFCSRVCAERETASWSYLLSERKQDIKALRVCLSLC